ncbi:hypothetical protein BASA61_003164, partial [Batrachochytrium salamandrivorans]
DREAALLSRCDPGEGTTCRILRLAFSGLRRLVFHNKDGGDKIAVVWNSSPRRQPGSGKTKLHIMHRRSVSTVTFRDGLIAMCVWVF